MTTLEDLCAELECGDDARAELAAGRLPEYGAEALKRLQKLLASEQVDSRWWAVRALAGFDNTGDVTDALLSALQDDSTEVRQAAVMAFCHHPTIQALAPLVHALSDPDAMIARLASTALALLGASSTSALLDVLKNGRQSARLEAARALAEIKDTGSIPGLMQALESDSALMQYWASLGLEKMGVGMIYLKPE